MPYIVRKISLIQTDNTLIGMREQVISLISKIGIEPFISSDSGNGFGSYNILKEEFISLESYAGPEDFNFIDVSNRIIEDENITYRVLNYSFKVDGNKYLLEVGRSLESIHHTEKNIRHVMLIFLVFIIIISFITDMLYTGRLLRPLDAIIRKLKNISNPAAFDKNPVKTSTYDFRSLDDALKELMERIDLLFRKEKEITVNISHELLTPVSVIRSKLENLLLKEDISPEISMQIEESLKTLHRLQSLVNSLLMIARIESRQYLKEETFSIAQVLSEIISELEPIAEDLNIIIKKELEGDFNIIKANRSLIFSMFYNVINNALKNTPQKGSVTIRSLTDNNKYLVTVSDTGKGFSEDQMSNLFLRFKTRSENSGKGTGIGLAISKTIADFHEIKIRVKTEIGTGTVFSFIFPENS